MTAAEDAIRLSTLRTLLTRETSVMDPEDVPGLMKAIRAAAEADRTAVDYTLPRYTPGQPLNGYQILHAGLTAARNMYAHAAEEYCRALDHVAADILTATCPAAATFVFDINRDDSGDADLVGRAVMIADMQGRPLWISDGVRDEYTDGRVIMPAADGWEAVDTPEYGCMFKLLGDVADLAAEIVAEAAQASTFGASRYLTADEELIHFDDPYTADPWTLDLRAHAPKQTAAKGRARKPVKRKVENLADGDVFSLDGGLTWHVCGVVLAGVVSVYLPGYRIGRDNAQLVRVPADRDAIVHVAARLRAGTLVGEDIRPSTLNRKGV